jgi:hypothetical protein
MWVIDVPRRRTCPSRGCFRLAFVWVIHRSLEELTVSRLTTLHSCNVAMLTLCAVCSLPMSSLACPRSGMNGWATFPSARPSLTPWMRKFKLAISVTLSNGSKWMLEAMHFLLGDGRDNQTRVITTRKLLESLLQMQIRKISRFP